ncbi:MAG TPA: hypothetical protein VHB73_01665, partial [Alphaproteobacteria bacterium]|nr:hypothetical protein [Alphaproteobacteria bacterium]
MLDPFIQQLVDDKLIKLSHSGELASFLFEAQRAALGGPHPTRVGFVAFVRGEGDHKKKKLLVSRSHNDIPIPIKLTKERYKRRNWPFYELHAEFYGAMNAARHGHALRNADIAVSEGCCSACATALSILRPKRGILSLESMIQRTEW